jgi:hypothetical protein
LQSALSDDPDANIYLLESTRSQSATDIDLIENSTTGSLDLGLVNEISLISGQNLNLDASTVSGRIITFLGSGDDLGETISILGTSAADTIELSNITVDTNDISTFTIDGGVSGDDIITGTAGNDIIIGRYGADQINLIEGGADKITFMTSGDGAAAGSPTGSDTITNFLSNDDEILVGGDLATALDGADQTFDGTVLNTTAGDEQQIDLTAANTIEYLFLSKDGTSITAENLVDTTEVATAFEAEVELQNSTVGRDILLAIESTTTGKFGIYYFADTDLNPGTIDPVELSVLAVVTADAFSKNYFDYDFG